MPSSHTDKARTMRQIDDIRVSVATKISQKFTLSLNGNEIVGKPVIGEVALSDTGNGLHLLMSEECAVANCPPYALVSLIADLCEIRDAADISLLHVVMSNRNLKSIYSTFRQQGIFIQDMIFGMHTTLVRVNEG